MREIFKLSFNEQTSFAYTVGGELPASFERDGLTNIDTSPVRGEFSCRASVTRCRLVRQVEIKMERSEWRRDDQHAASESDQRVESRDV